MQSPSVSTWYNVSPEKRHLKARKLPADVYLQDPKQEEDNMSVERVRKGFLINVPTCEHDSLLYNAKTQKLDKMEDISSRGLVMVQQLIKKKTELNSMNLDRKRRKEEEAPTSLIHPMNPKDKRDKHKDDRHAWMEELAKREGSKHQLKKRIPFFKDQRDKAEAFNMIYQFKVPIQRAIWFLKMHQLGELTMHSQSKKPTKQSGDGPGEQLTRLFVMQLKLWLRSIRDAPQVENCPAYQRWPYFVCLFKQSFEEGILDRNEFLLELCDMLGEYSSSERFSMEKPQIFRMLVILMSQFVAVITQNVVISRRIAYIIAVRCQLYKRDYERRRGLALDSSSLAECFNDLIHCQHHRAIMLTMLGLLHAIIIDCPAALVWNPFHKDVVFEPFCGSPFDTLPCSPDVLSQHLPETSEKIRHLLQIRIDEITARSRNVDNRWPVRTDGDISFEDIVEKCLDVISSLDMALLNVPKALMRLYKIMLSVEPSEQNEDELRLRIRVMLQWAVTTEREGSHRAAVVCRLLKMRYLHYGDKAFGRQSLHDILVEYLTHESPRPASPAFRREYANLIFLFFELQRHGLFNHDQYVRAMMRCGQFSYQEPIMGRLKKFTAPPPAPTQPARAPSPEQKADPAIISFIPTTTSSATTSSHKGASKSGDDIALLTEPTDEHIFMDSPKEMSLHERFLLQLPVEQTDSMRDTCNQRAVVLYGITDEREEVKRELQKVAREICRIWQKKINVEFFNNSKEVRCKKRATAENLNEAMSKFRAQTYYDQLVICGYCADDFMATIVGFLKGDTLFLPTAECLDILFEMMETCQNIAGILSFSVELLSQLILLEKMLATFHTDCIPGTVSGQLAYVVATYLADHYHYFLYSNEASRLVNGLYRVVEKPLCAKGYPITAWARAVSLFVFHAKDDLTAANLETEPLLGDYEEFRRVFPESGAGHTAQPGLKYNRLLFSDFLKDPPPRHASTEHKDCIFVKFRRFYCYHEYKLHLPSIEDAHTRYSFVVNAFEAAHDCGYEYDKLAELANICGHVSAQKPLAGEWCVAIQELCAVSLDVGYPHLIEKIPVDNYGTHYSISTFVLLLASKYCFSTHALVTRLIENVFIPVIKEPSKITGSQHALCLAALIATSLVCGTDQPFIFQLDDSESTQPKKLLSRNADQRGLKIIQIRELDACIFPLLSAFSIICDTLKRAPSMDKNSKISQFFKCSLLAMCEQEWVVQRVFRICESRDMEPFNIPKLRNNYIGQQLLRIALRRRSERHTKQELMVCNGNSKKSLLDKLLSAMNVWNLRATYYDLKLMIKEMAPEGSSKLAQQQVMIAESQIGVIAECCNVLFMNAKKDGRDLSAPFKSLRDFRLEHIDCYWLITPLIVACPALSSSLQQTSKAITVKEKFLKEAEKFLKESETSLDTRNDNTPERLSQSAWLLNQKPFTNLLLACLRGEEAQRDTLVQNALLRPIQDLVSRVKESPCYPFQSSFGLEREGLLLRLNLVGGMFESVMNNNSDAWALVLFQLLYYGVVTVERDGRYFDVCYDMLLTLVYGTVSANTQSGDAKEGKQKPYNLSPYKSLVRKIQKELNDRTIPADLHCLAQLLPVPKSFGETNAWEPSPSSPQKQTKGTQGTVAVPAQRPAMTAMRLDKTPQPVQRYLMRLLHHTHYAEFPSPGLVGVTRTSAAFGTDLFLSSPSSELNRDPIPNVVTAQSSTPQPLQQQPPASAPGTQSTMQNRFGLGQSAPTGMPMDAARPMPNVGAQQSIMQQQQGSGVAGQFMPPRSMQHMGMGSQSQQPQGLGQSGPTPMSGNMPPGSGMMHGMDTSTGNLPMSMGLGQSMGPGGMPYQQSGIGGMHGMSAGMLAEQMRPAGLPPSESPRAPTSGRGRGRKNPGGPPAQRGPKRKKEQPKLLMPGGMNPGMDQQFQPHPGYGGIQPMQQPMQGMHYWQQQMPMQGMQGGMGPGGMGPSAGGPGSMPGGPMMQSGLGGPSGMHPQPNMNTSAMDSKQKVHDFILHRQQTKQ